MKTLFLISRTCAFSFSQSDKPRGREEMDKRLRVNPWAWVFTHISVRVIGVFEKLLLDVLLELLFGSGFDLSNAFSANGEHFSNFLKGMDDTINETKAKEKNGTFTLVKILIKGGDELLFFVLFCFIRIIHRCRLSLHESSPNGGSFSSKKSTPSIISPFVKGLTKG